MPDFVVSTGAGQASVSFDLNVENWLTNQMLSDGVIADGDLTGQLTVVVAPFGLGNEHPGGSDDLADVEGVVIDLADDRSLDRLRLAADRDLSIEVSRLQ